MLPLTTVLIIGGSGAGKTKYVERYAGMEGFVHINPDMFAEKIKAEMVASDKSLMRGNLNTLVTVASAEGFFVFIDELRALYAKRQPLVVIDCPPVGNLKFHENLVKESRAARRRVIVEGLWVDPFIALPRKLLSFNEFSPVKTNAHLVKADNTFRGGGFLSFLTTHKFLPQVWFDLVWRTNIHSATLYDNNGDDAKGLADLPIVASWQSGKPVKKFDPVEKGKFDQLARMDLTTANFRMALESQDVSGGQSGQALKIELFNLYGIEASYPRNRMPPAAPVAGCSR